MRKYKREDKKIRNLVGRCSSVRVARILYDVSKDFASYWIRKAKDKKFHPSGHGGLRVFKYTPEQHVQIRFLVWKKVKLNPLST